MLDLSSLHDTFTLKGLTKVIESKVISLILQGSYKAVIPLGTPKYPIMSETRSSDPFQTRAANKSPNMNLDRLDTFLQHLSLGIPEVDELGAVLTERLALVIFTLSQLLAERPTVAPLGSAFLLHAVLLSHTPLSARRMKGKEIVDDSQFKDYNLFLDDFSLAARSAIDSSRWKQHMNDSGAQCDLADLVDERLFFMVISKIQGSSNPKSLLPEKIVKEFEFFASIIKVHSGSQVQLSAKHFLTGRYLLPPLEQITVSSVLPFSNAVFDQHLESMRIDIKARDFSGANARSMRIFKEITHWHSSNRPIDTKAIRIASDWQRQWLLKRNQRHMDEMLKYAASLTNASGKILDPKTVIVQKENRPSPSVNAKATKNTSDDKKSRTGKTPPVSKGKKIVQSSISSKKDAYVQKAFSSWANMIEILDKIINPYARYRSTWTYLEDLVIEKREILAAEITLYGLQPLLEIWSGFCRADKRETGYKIAALIWNQINTILKVKSGLTETIVVHTLEICRLIGFPKENKLPTAIDRPLTFALKVPPTLTFTLSIGLSSQEFQLVHCGPYMDRNTESLPDPRVPFNPDGWQRAVLDELDANNSVFVVAPTSAGKTFISFYAMEKILQADDDGVLVYVAPTKALVNQIAAEVQARFSKKYKHGGKSVWATHTRDHRVNDATSCQILVTVPHILQIMLLAPSNAKTWAPRVKRIIFDEIHSIGQAEDGVVWEQLLLLAPCPIIALSATVGNPQQFNDWLAATQRALGFKLTMIQHHQRYSDLRKFMYNPSSNLAFEGLEKSLALGNLGLDGAPEFEFFHPIASLVNRSRGMPADLALEARDCFTLWKTMTKHQTSNYPIPEKLRPSASFPQTISKVDIIDWEKGLKAILSLWILDSNSPFDKVHEDLSAPLKTPLAHRAHRYVESFGISNYLRQTALPLMTQLYKQDALPAILFNFDRSECEKIALAVLDSLERAEISWKNGSAKWKSEMEGYEKWKETKNIKIRREVRSGKKNKVGDAERVSRTEIERESIEQIGSKYESFDPNAPCEDFSFAVPHTVEKIEIEGYFKKMEWRGVPQWLIKALRRGIAVHHAGMNRHYRQT